MTHNESGLPAHWRRGRRLAFASTLLVTGIVTYALRGLGSADRMDSWWLAARFTARDAWRAPQPRDPDIVLVSLDDHSADLLPEPIVGWGGYLAAAVQNLTRSGAKVIAMDWLQPVPMARWFPGNDEKLATAISKAPDIVFVKAMRWNRGERLPQWITTTPELLYAAPNTVQNPEACLGYAELRKGEAIVAAIPPVLPEEPTEVSFAARIVEHYYRGIGQKKDNVWNIPGHVSVPLREDGTVLVNYARGTGRQSPFANYSLVDIARMRQPDPAFQGKIVLIGSMLSDNNDHHFVPFLSGLSETRAIPGVQIQATILRTLLSAHPIREPTRRDLWLLAMALSSVGLLAFARLPWLAAVFAYLGLGVSWIVLSFGLFAWADYALPIMLPLLGMLVSSGMMGGYLVLSEGRERQQVLGLWGRYQDPRLVQYLLHYPQARGGEGGGTTVTVLFADLKNFTKTVEKLSPTETIRTLNRYLELMQQVVVEYGGFVDKYLGDGLMAQWGAPPDWTTTDSVDPPRAAVLACLEIQKRAAALTDALSLPSTGDVTFGLRLTLHSGPVIAGWVGAARLEYTIIGDTVNVTSRLQETAKALDCELLISEETYKSVQDLICTGKEAEVEIRGRQGRLRVYEVVGAHTTDPVATGEPGKGEEK